jgi:hypothetical protein
MSSERKRTMDPGAANPTSVQSHSPTSISRTNKHTIKVALIKVAKARCLFPNVLGYWPSFQYPEGDESNDSSSLEYFGPVDITPILRNTWLIMLSLISSEQGKKAKRGDSRVTLAATVGKGSTTSQIARPTPKHRATTMSQPW